MLEKEAPKDPLDPREIARRLGYSVSGKDPIPDPRGGYHARKGYRKLPRVEDSDEHGTLVWAATEEVKKD
jgi:hypothetical protein